ncbi:MAG: hypothetical protein ACQEQ7_01640 [Thermodesulfobacteriota bacterium]
MMIEKAENDKKANFVMWLMPYLALLVVHIVMGLRMECPTIFPDEAGYLGRSRYLAGVAGIIQGSGFYHFGYPLFLLPAFWFFSDPNEAYLAIMVINSLLMSSLYFGLVYIFYILLEYPKRTSSLVAFTCCLYPAFILQSNLAWSENAFIPFYAFFIASVGVLVKKKSWYSALLFAFLSGFLYTIHPRALLILPISIFFLLFLSVSRVLSRLKAFLSGTLILIIFGMTRYINDFLSSLDNGRTVHDYVKQEIFDILNPSNWPPLALTAVGQFLYLVEVTYGLFLIGLIYICKEIWRRCSDGNFLNAFDDVNFDIMVVMITTSAAILIPSSVVILGVNAGDDLIYGRYNEGFLGLYVAFALLGIYKGYSLKPHENIGAFGISIIILLLSCIVLLGYDYTTLFNWCKIANVIIVNIFGIYPFIGIFRRLDLLMVAIIVIFLLSILLYAFRIRFFLGLSLLMVYFISVSAAGYTVLFVRSEYIKNITTLKYDIASLGNIKDLSYDRSYFDSETWFSYQYFLPDVKFNTFYSTKGEIPSSRVVVSSTDWNGGGKLKAELLAVENPSAQVPPIMRKLIEFFFNKPLKPKKKINQALWRVKENG